MEVRIMPRGDGSGPMGMGPMTGRGAGYCTGATTRGYANPGSGFGLGRGFGRGFGRNFFAGGAPIYNRFSGFGQTSGLPVNEKEILSDQAKQLQEQLEDINKRLADL
jgi:hypothetical protein